MESKIRLNTTNVERGASHKNASQTQATAMPILPKNCVAMFGNNPVMLGQKVVITKNDSNIPTVVKEIETHPSPPKIKKMSKKDVSTVGHETEKRNALSQTSASFLSHISTTTSTTTTSTVSATGVLSSPSVSKSVSVAQEVPLLAVKAIISELKASRIMKDLARKNVQQSSNMAVSSGSHSTDGPLSTTDTNKTIRMVHPDENKRSLLTDSSKVHAKPNFVTKPKGEMDDHTYNGFLPGSRKKGSPRVAGLPVEDVSLSRVKSVKPTLSKSSLRGILGSKQILPKSSAESRLGSQKILSKSSASSTLGSQQILPAGSIVQVKSIKPRQAISHVKVDNVVKRPVSHPQLLDSRKRIAQFEGQTLTPIALTPVVSGTGSQMSMVIGSIASLGQQTLEVSCKSTVPTFVRQTPGNATTCLKQMSGIATGASILRQMPNASTSATLVKQMPVTSTGATFLKQIPSASTSATFLKQIPNSSSSATFLKQIPNSSSSATFLKQIPISSKGAAFLKQIPGTINTTFLKQIPASSASTTILKQIPTSSTSATFFKQVPGSTTSTSATSLKQKSAISTGATFLTIPSSNTSATLLQPIPGSNTTFSLLNQTPGISNKRNNNKILVPISKPLRVFPSNASITSSTTVQSVITAASLEDCPTLKTILAMPVSQYLLSSLPSVNSALNPNVSTISNKSTSTVSHQEGFQQENKSPATSSNVDCYTSLERYEQGQSVMVMRPVLDSDSLGDNNSNSSEAMFMHTEDNQNLNKLNTHSGHESNSNKGKSVPTYHRMMYGGQEIIMVRNHFDKALVDKTQNDKFLKDLKIQSVVSLANVPSSNHIEEGVATSHNEDAEYISDERDSEMNSDSEEETTYNINDNEWRNLFPPSYVVLERLYPQDIKKRLLGEKKTSVQCSHHCRERTLSLLCDLNLMQCEHQLCTNKNAVSNVSSETDPTTECKPLVDVKQTQMNDQQSTLCPVKIEEEIIDLPPVIESQENSKKESGGIETLESSLRNDKQHEAEISAKDARLCDKAKEDDPPLPDAAEIVISEREEGSLKGQSPLSSPKIISFRHCDQLERDIISLRKQVEEKRYQMRLRKMGKQVHASKYKAKAASKVKFGDKSLSPTSTDLPKQGGKKLPVILGSLLQSKTSPTNKHQGNKAVLLKPRPHQAQHGTIQPKSSASAVSKASTVPSIVLNCPASSLFPSDNKEASQRKHSNLLTSLPVVMPTNAPAPDKGNPLMRLHLGKVYSALNSLAEHFRSKGLKPNGTQFVMLKDNFNTPIVLKIEPDALLPHNLDTLRKRIEASSSHSNSKSTAQVKPLTDKTTLPSQNQSTAQLAKPSQSIASSVHQKSHLSPNPTTVEKSKSPAIHKPPSNPQKNILNRDVTNPNNSRTAISNLPYDNSSLTHYPSSQRNLRSLLTTKSSFIANPVVLTHIPHSSGLLPERQKRLASHLTAEERAAKRKRLEEKYPLPPGVIIKCEPDSSEYELDNNWSVTSEIETGYMTSTQEADFITDNTHLSNLRQAVGEINNQQEPITTVTERDSMGDIFDNTDSPPPLDTIPLSTSNMGKEAELSQIMDTDETPPVLQPMAALSGSQSSPFEIEDDESPSTSTVSITSRQQAQFYDSGYDSVGPSSSSESLIGKCTQQEKIDFSKMSKIERLKEILKQKQQQVENMMKKRSTIPEIDLNSL